MTYRTLGSAGLAVASIARQGAAASSRDGRRWAVPPGARRAGWLREPTAEPTWSVSGAPRIALAGPRRPALNHHH